MNICISTKQYMKASRDTQRAIWAAIIELYRRIQLYEKQGTSFEKIFNDDQVKYDQHGDFFTFKCQKNHLQLRILYAYMKIEGIPTIIVGDYFIKKKNNKEYIKQFEVFNHIEPMSMYRQSYYKEQGNYSADSIPRGVFSH